MEKLIYTNILNIIQNINNNTYGEFTMKFIKNTKSNIFFVALIMISLVILSLYIYFEFYTCKNHNCLKQWKQHVCILQKAVLYSPRL